jgi:hypothetical protein
MAVLTAMATGVFMAIGNLERFDARRESFG